MARSFCIAQIEAALLVERTGTRWKDGGDIALLQFVDARNLCTSRQADPFTIGSASDLTSHFTFDLLRDHRTVRCLSSSATMLRKSKSLVVSVVVEAEFGVAAPEGSDAFCHTCRRCR